MNRACLALALCLGCLPTTSAPAAERSCSASPPLTLRVRFATEAAREVLLEANAPSGLRLRDAATGVELWSASAGGGATQQIEGLNSAFGTSLTAVHLDADGLHDRIYAGDRAGRLWRFDLQDGARPATWMRATILADLVVPGGGRGFIAAPDVSRSESPAGPVWLNIAIGTANTATPRADHRFYVLRDALGSTRPNAPLREADLEPVTSPLGITNDNTRGYYLPLGAAQVLAPALTLDGRIHFTVVESSANLLAGCAEGLLPLPVPISVTVVRADDGQLATDSNGNGRTDVRDLRRSLGRALPANAGVQLTSATAGSDGRMLCHVDTLPLPDCFLDTRPRRTWWRRDDAE
jgi:hypothetical protein